MSMLNKAIEIAAKAHAGQTDKGGKPYILHPLTVMMNFCNTETEQICAVLHDVIEDTDITLDDLRKEGFSEEIITALDCLTKRKDENYNDYISRILTNPTACIVKQGDLANNIDLTRIPNPTEKDKERVKKYSEAADRVMDAIPGADAISDCRYIEINGVAEVHPCISANQFNEMFINFIEAHNWFFGGTVCDVTDTIDSDDDLNCDELTKVKTELAELKKRFGLDIQEDFLNTHENITLKEFAAMLHGRDRTPNLSENEILLAKQKGFVVVYGESDDRVEFEGAIREEAHTNPLADSDMIVLPDIGKLLTEDTAEYDKYAEEDKNVIDVFYCKEDGPRWQFEANIPCETFLTYDDEYGNKHNEEFDEEFCIEPFAKCVVFKLSDLK